MKLSIFLLALLAILGVQVMCSHVKSQPGDVITMSSRDTINQRPGDQTELHRVKRGIKKHIRKGLGSVFKKGVSSVFKKRGSSHTKRGGRPGTKPGAKRGGRRGTKPGAPSPVTSPERRAQAITKAFVSRLPISRNHPGGKKFITKFLDKIRNAARGSASARSHLKSLLSTLLDLGNQGASLAAVITQILALTKQTPSREVIHQQEPDDLTPLLLALIKPDNSGSNGVQSSVLVSALTVCVCRLLSQAH